MSLEAAIEKLNGNIEKLVEQNEKILNIAASRQAAGSTDSGSAASDKPKRTSTKKDDKAKDDGDKATTKADLTAGLAGWLNEFGKVENGKENHPESVARHGALKTVLGKVGGDGFTLKTLAEDDQEKIDKLFNWLENTAKKADKGHGISRLVADPEAAEDENAEEDLGV